MWTYSSGGGDDAEGDVVNGKVRVGADLNEGHGGRERREEGGVESVLRGGEGERRKKVVGEPTQTPLCPLSIAEHRPLS